jgi:hypothetical protein
MNKLRRRLIPWSILIAALLAFCLVLTFTLGEYARAQPQTQSKNYPASEREAIEYFSLVESLRGELRVTKALVNLGYFDRALFHVGEPVDSILNVLKGKVNLGLTSSRFLIDLYNFREYFRVSADKDLLLKQYQRVMQNLDTAVNEQPTAMKWRSLPVLLSVVDSSLFQVGQYYRDAVRSGLLVNPSDFETARGLLEALNEGVFLQISEPLRKVNPVAVANMETAMAKILAAIPTPVISGVNPVEIGEIESAINEFNRACDEVFQM